MSEQVEKDRVVCFHYDMYGPDGALMESSRGGEPIAILQGHGAVIRGLDAALLGHRVGDRFEVDVPPSEGYGERIEGLTERVSKKHLPRAARLKVGDRTVMHTADGHRHVTVTKVGAKMVDVDLNHPMAGRQLRFEVEITQTREATAEELAHGHVHGPGGHHH